MEAFTSCAKAIWSQSSSIIHNAHSLVSLIAWKFNWLIFNNILFDNGFSCFLTFWLLNCILININVRYETIVAWNMVGHLGGSDRKLKVSICLLCSIMRQNISWVVTMVSVWVSEFCLILSSWWAISLSIDGPKWSSWFNLISRSSCINNSFISWFPVLSWIDILAHSLTSICEAHWCKWSLNTTAESHWLSSGHVSSKFCRIEQLWVMNVFITKHCVHAFGWNLIISSLYILILVLIIHRLETPVIS